MKNIIISAGHGYRDSGAISGDLIEHLIAYPIVWHLRTELESRDCKVEWVSCFQSLAAKIRETNEWHAHKLVDLAVEIHFNSAEDPHAQGTECLFYSQKVQPVAEKVSAYASNAIQTVNRGPKHRTDLGWLKQLRCPSLIVEVAFISNADDAFRIRHDDFSRTVAKAIAEAITA